MELDYITAYSQNGSEITIEYTGDGLFFLECGMDMLTVDLDFIRDTLRTDGYRAAYDLMQAAEMHG